MLTLGMLDSRHKPPLLLKSVLRYIKGMKALLWISVIIAAIIFFQELTWIGKSGLAPVIMGLAVAIGLQAGYLLWKK